MYFITGPTTAPQNVTVKRFSDAMFISWSEVSTVQSRGFPVYIVQYQPTNAGSASRTTNIISENYVLIENLSPNNNYLVSVAAAVREGQEILMGPNSEVMAVSSSSKLQLRIHNKCKWTLAVDIYVYWVPIPSMHTANIHINSV